MTTFLSELPATSTSSALAMPEEPVLPLSIEAYHALLKVGILQDGDPIELLEGFLVPKMTKGLRHEFARRRLVRRLLALVGEDYFVDSQGVATLITSEPEPDVFVIRGNEDDYVVRHAGPADTVLVVEVAESSLRRDRNWKKRVYARASIACYWVVNLIDDCIEVATQPSGSVEKPVYAQTQVYRAGEAVPVVIDGAELGRISVSDLLGASE